MKNFSLFIFLLLAIGFTSCEKSETETVVFDLKGQYEATVLKTTTVSDQNGVVSVDESVENFQVVIDNDRFSRADKSDQAITC